MRDFIRITESSDAGSSARSALQLAQAEFDKKNYLGSAEHYCEILKHNSTHAIAIHNLGGLIAHAGRDSKTVVEIIEMALKVIPRDLSLLYLKAKYCFRKYKFKEAAELCDLIIKVDPTHKALILASHIYFTQARSEGDAFIKSEKYQNALKYIEIYLKPYPYDLSALKQKLVVLAGMKNHEKVLSVAQEILKVASFHTQTVVEIDSVSTLAYRQMLYALRMQNRHAEIVKLVDDALSHVSGPAIFIKYLHVSKYASLEVWAGGITEASEKNRLLEEALQSSKEAVKIEPDSLDHVRIGQLYFVLGRLDVALAYFDEVLKDETFYSEPLLTRKFNFLEHQFVACKDEEARKATAIKMLECSQNLLKRELGVSGYEKLGVSLNLLRQWDEVIAQLEPVIEHEYFCSMRICNQLLKAYLYKARDVSDEATKAVFNKKAEDILKITVHGEPSAEDYATRAAILEKFGFAEVCRSESERKPGSLLSTGSGERVATVAGPTTTVAIAGAGDAGVRVPAECLPMAKAIATLGVAAAGAGVGASSTRVERTESVGSFESLDMAALGVESTNLAAGW